jgi:TatD DNase family protein
VQDERGREVQREIFLKFIRLAERLDLPLNVHSRSAGREAIRFLREASARRVLLHAFDGKAASALEGVEAGYCFSIPPSILRSPQKQKLVRRLPLDRLLLETDSPVLGPDPKLRNEPKNVLIACRAVSEIKGVAAEEVAEVTTENAKALFPKAFDPSIR